MPIGMFDSVLEMIELYLRDTGGSYTECYLALRRDEPLGQAFFNALNRDDQNRIAGTIYDPFHFGGAKKVWEALEYLMGK